MLAVAANRSKVDSASPTEQAGNSWGQRYGTKHRWQRLSLFPAGILPPQKVRVYQRSNHYLLNWWDPAARKNLSQRIDGDLLSALAQARLIDERVTTTRTAGLGQGRRIGHAELIGKYLEDLERRAEAGEIALATVRRYEAALQHYLNYCADAALAGRYSNAAAVNWEFRLGLQSFLKLAPERSPSLSGSKKLNNSEYVLETVRAAYSWAADPDRGGLLPEGFRNPFLRCGDPRPVLRGDPLAAPDITMPMAVEFLRGCDAFQLRLFVPFILFGLRASEPCWLFAEDLTEDWLQVPCRPELNVFTKGRRDKRFPLLPELAPFWNLLRGGSRRGLLYSRRRTEARDGLFGRTPEVMVGDWIQEYARQTQKMPLMATRMAARNRLLRAGGGLDYDFIEGEFRQIAGRLGWSRAATLKDLRHLFATAMNNAGMPEGYRRYLLGHAPGTAAAVAYTHLNDLCRHYEAAVRGEFSEVIAVIQDRMRDMSDFPQAQDADPGNNPCKASALKSSSE